MSVDLRTRTKQLGTKEKTRRKKSYSDLSEKIHEDLGENAVQNRFGFRESVERTSRGHRVHRKVEIEEADGSSSSRKEGIGVALIFHGSEYLGS